MPTKKKLKVLSKSIKLCQNRKKINWNKLNQKFKNKVNQKRRKKNRIKLKMLTK